MSKAITRAATTSLTVAGATAFDSDHSGAGEVKILVRLRGRKLRLHVSIYELPGDHDPEDLEAPRTDLIADVEPAEFCELLAFERTIRSMVAERQADLGEALAVERTVRGMIAEAVFGGSDALDRAAWAAIEHVRGWGMGAKGIANIRRESQFTRGVADAIRGALAGD